MEVFQGIDWSLNPEYTSDIAVLSGPVYAIVNILKRIFGVKDARVLMIVVGVSLLLGFLVLIAAFEPVRNYLYAVMLSIMGALGIRESDRWEQKDNPPEAPVPHENAPSEPVRPFIERNAP